MTDSPKPCRRLRSKTRFAFMPAQVRARHDGWTPEKQRAFIEALAEEGCVEQACARVGMSKQSAYALRRGQDAKSFREAWDAALQYAVQRLSDAVLARAIHGQAVPHYYKGEVVGEHRRYDNRLATFLLRYRDPLRFSKMMDYKEFAGTYERINTKLAGLVDEVVADAEEAGRTGRTGRSKTRSCRALRLPAKAGAQDRPRSRHASRASRPSTSLGTNGEGQEGDLLYPNGMDVPPKAEPEEFAPPWRNRGW